MKIGLAITLTWSKVVAFLLLGIALFEDLYFKLDGKLFMFVVPFVVVLITGKQLIDWRENKNNNNNIN